MPRKVLTSHEVMNSMGGGDAIISMFRKMGFMKFLDDALGKRSARAEYTYSEALITWFVSVYSGARRLEDLYHYRDCMKAHPKLKKGITPDTLSRVFKELSVPNKYFGIKDRPDMREGNEVNNNPKLNRVLIESCLKLGLLKKNVPYILDFDTTSIYTKIKGGRKIYEGQGKRGYSNALAAINNLPVYFECRNGNSSPSHRLVNLICEAIDMLEEFGIKVGKVRVDRAAYSYKFVTEMNRRNIFYVTRVRDKVVPKHPTWQKGIGIDDWVSEFEYDFGDRKQRVVLHTDFKYTGGIITNDYHTSKEIIIQTYRDRGYKAEGVFKSLKDEFLWEIPAMRTIEHNSTFMIIEALCYNAFKYLTRILSTKLQFVKENMELKTFRSDFMAVVQKWKDNTLHFIHPTKNYSPLSGFV